MLLAAGTTALADPAIIARDTALRASSLSDAAVVASLKAQTTIDVIERRGAWAQVRVAGGKSGWVRLLNLRTAGTQRGDSGAGAVASVFRTGSSGSSVSTGVKGMSEEDLTGAKPDPGQVRQLSAWRATEPDARQSARDAGLSAQSVRYLEGGKASRRKRDKDED